MVISGNYRDITIPFIDGNYPSKIIPTAHPVVGPRIGSNTIKPTVALRAAQR